jgi:hypothetical protein
MGEGVCHSARGIPGEGGDVPGAEVPRDEDERGLSRVECAGVGDVRSPALPAVRERGANNLGFHVPVLARSDRQVAERRDPPGVEVVAVRPRGQHGDPPRVGAGRTRAGKFAVPSASSARIPGGLAVRMADPLAGASRRRATSSGIGASARCV